MARTSLEIVETWFAEVWNKGRPEAIDEYVSADWVGHGSIPGPPDQSRLDRFKILYRNFRAAFPDISIAVEKAIAAGDTVAAFCVLRGTHTGSDLGVAATGRKISFSGTVIVRCADGKIAETWETWDFLSMYTQFGQTLT